MLTFLSSFSLLHLLLLLTGSAEAFSSPSRHGRIVRVVGSGRFASLTTASAVDDNVRSDKRVRKLKKALKRIGELRHQDYLSLTTDQRVKVHGEHAVMDELAALLQLENADEREALRVTLQPGLLKPMPPSQEWSFEVSKERAKQKTRERRALEAELELRPGELPKGGNVRKGDWRCSNCGTLCWASRDACFSCGEPR
jgi:rubrerythrin